MKNHTIAKRYARALYQVASDGKAVEDVMTGFQNLRTALDTSEDLRKVFYNPLVKPEEKSAVVKSITSNKLILKFTALLAKRKRLDLIDTIIEEFTVYSDTDHDIRRVLVKSAVRLNEEQKKTVEKELAAKLGGQVIGQFEVAKELIGGIWVRLGDKVLDATVRGRFEDLRHHLINSTN